MNEEPSIEIVGDADAGSPPRHNAATSGVALMITRAQRADLRALSYAGEAIGAMTPTHAHEILRDARRQDP